MSGGAPLFDGYLVVDWSAASKPVTGTDSIWLAMMVGGELTLENPPTRREAEVKIAAFLDQSASKGQRILAGFDFPFGYPKGFADALEPGGDWRNVWAWLAAEITEGDKNANNRFEVAAKLNRMTPGEGPFWGNGLKADIPGLPRLKPSGWGETLPANLRDSDKRAKAAQEVWKLSGVGSVGGQALTGIATLERLRHSTGAQVWPFETLGQGKAHVLAEVFPSLTAIPFPDGKIRDAVQVEALARAFAKVDATGQLAEMLAAPALLSPHVRTDEATILGLDHAAELAAAIASVEITHAPDGKPQKSKPLKRRTMRPYEKDPARIYAESFATVRREARLDRFPAGLDALAIRLIHACGMIDVADRLSFSPDAFEAGRNALESGAPIFADCEMAAAGIIRRNLPADNEVIVTLNDPRTPGLAADLGTTRSAAAVSLWGDRLDGAIVAIGNAPTALFHLLETIDAGGPRPSVILGFPVGFVGAAESKAELATNPRGCAFVTLRGRRGGSAMASAAVNALAAGLPEERT